MSLAQAFNLRDSDEIDRRVANFSDGALEQQTIDTDRDMATALQMSFDEPPNELRTSVPELPDLPDVPEIPARVETAKGEHNFVQTDNGSIATEDGAVDSGSSGAPLGPQQSTTRDSAAAIAVRMIFDNSDEEAFDNPVEETVAEAENEWGPGEGSADGGTNTAKELLNSTDFAIANNKRKLEERVIKSKSKKTRTEAMELLGRQPELLTSQAEVEAQPDQVEIDWANKERPHITHTMIRMHGDGEVLFCSVCSYWLKNKRLTASLRNPCEALKRSNWSKLRMLQCGVMPGPGARLPPSMARAKGTARSSAGVTGRRCTPINPNV